MDELILAFTLGNAAILTNACLLPLYPGLIAFLAGSSSAGQQPRAPWSLGFFVLAGILTMMTGIGFVLAALSASFADLLPVLLPIVYALVILFGVLMLLGRNPFEQMQTLQSPTLRSPYLTAYVYGLLFGPMTLPCTGPIILSAFTVGGTAGDIASGLLFFLFFGLGFGWPLLLLPLVAQPLQRRIVTWLAYRHDALNRAAGILLVAVGLFGILTELLPRVAPELYFEQSAQLIYWALVLGLALLVGLRPGTTLAPADH